MERIEALERRLAQALDRIGTALLRPAAGEAELSAARAERDAAVARAAEAEAEAARLRQALEEEALVGRQLGARNEALHDKVAAAEAMVRDLRAELAQRDALAAQFRRVNAQLRQNNLALREAAERGLPDAHLVNKAMLTELESIRASRDAERVEIDSVLAELRAILEPHGESADA